MSPLEKSQYLEAKVLMPGYILSSQGDRMSMAHGVEGRFPFLDPNVIRFATRLPSYFRVLGFKEKWLLKRLGGRLLPESIWGRHKQPFRAPDAEILQQGKSQNGESLLSFLSPERVRNAGIFSPVAVEKLRKRSQESQRPLSIRDQMALTFALSTQILHESYITR
jgi:asparagine synthase (glutamine-hydrolysing)